jgi:hypothetical protein
MKSSWGPDFVSKTGRMHCDMCTRVLMPICENGKEPKDADCFYLGKSIMRKSISSVLGARGKQDVVVRAMKRYIDVEEWGK